MLNNVCAEFDISRLFSPLLLIVLFFFFFFFCMICDNTNSLEADPGPICSAHKCDVEVESG